MNILSNKRFITSSLLLYAALIFLLSHMTFQDSGSGFVINDKVLHFTEYALLGYLLMRYFFINKEKEPGSAAFLSLAAGSLYAASDEIHQGFVGYFSSGIFGGVRNPDALDFIADITGVAAAAVLYIIINRFKIPKTKMQE
ncbi:MAG: hypothetical protein A2Y39_04670 [Candidatus Delongbacteria bacterium GWF2_40_14]|nr:MAG: hypothetical protein A2Y39_04670 [Candidatus Delongbacteria bacterium GWF2_40_14]